MNENESFVSNYELNKILIISSIFQRDSIYTFIQSQHVTYFPYTQGIRHTRLISFKKLIVR